MQFSLSSPVVFVLAGCLLAGCAGESTSDPTPSSGSAEPTSDAETSTGATDSEDIGPNRTAFRPVQLGGAPTTTAADLDETSETTGGSTEPPKFEDVVAALKPIQIVMGKWQGIIQNASKSEIHDWVWDLKTDPVYPALVLNIPEGEFFSNARITYDPGTRQYKMTTVDEESVKRSFVGDFVAAPKDVPSEDGKGVERTFQLEFTEQSGETRGTRFQYVFKQQHNNRYLLNVKRARGKAAFRLIDVIGSQREGVSFAKADDDYGDKTCIISGGLGTSTVSYKGKTYYVCCSGCKAAFEDEPERWIARLEEQKAEKMKSQ